MTDQTDSEYVMDEIVELARRDIARTQTDFIGRMYQALGGFEAICDEAAERLVHPANASEDAADQLAGLAGLALAQLCMVRRPNDPASLLSAAPPAPVNLTGTGVETMPDVLPGHWDTADGRKKGEYLDVDRSSLTKGDMSDLAVANGVFLASRYDLDLIVWQTAAKERIRWLSVQLARALTPPATEPLGKTERAALDQNDAMRQEMAHIGNLVSDLARAMGVDQANDDGSWPDLAGRIENLRSHAANIEPLADQAGERLREDHRRFRKIVGTVDEPEDLRAYASELESIIVGCFRQADQWRFIANEMGYEPNAHRHPPLNAWLTKRIAEFRRAAALADHPPAASTAVEAGGRFADYDTSDLAAQCRMQARENLDPEYSQFMFAVAARLVDLKNRSKS